MRGLVCKWTNGELSANSVLANLAQYLADDGANRSPASKVLSSPLHDHQLGMESATCAAEIFSP